MYNILIVDDECIERDGIKFLIEKYNLDLNVFEAENGEDALEYLKSGTVDILFTDIKMPFMDGLELARRAREMYPGIKIIIFSAYGEFDYAKRAIDVKAIHYLLKPINVSEFIDIFLKVIELCRKEHAEKEENKRIFEVYNIGKEFEKERILLDLIDGVEINDKFRKRFELIEMDLSNKFIQMVMVDFKFRYFDSANSDFKKILKDIVNYEYEYLNLNEQQSIIFLISSQMSLDKEKLRELFENLKDRIYETYKMAVTIVIGNSLNSIEKISSEYNQIEIVLENKFLYTESIVLFAHDIKSVSRTDCDEANKKVIKDILTIIENNYMKDISLEWMAEKVYLSPSYLSYLFKKETGRSFIKYVTAYRLNNARELLQNTNLKMVDVCKKVGYSDSSYFCQIFKSYYGVSPMKFREKEE